MSLPNALCFPAGSQTLFFCIICIGAGLNSLLIVTSSTTPINQTLALQHLYDSNNGPEWTYNLDGEPWNFSQPLALTEPCHGWGGITCDCDAYDDGDTNSGNDSDPICNIVNLNLFWSGLEGSLPETLSSLQYLSVLNLGFNELTGTVSTFNLTNLVYYNLGYNFLTGKNTLYCPICLYSCYNVWRYLYVCLAHCSYSLM